MMKRRRFLLAGMAVTGGVGALVIGWGVLPPRQRLTLAHTLEQDGRTVALNGWVRVGVDGLVTIAMPRSEMGQGVHTSLPMLLAEEMDASWASIRIEEAPPDKIFGNVAMLVDGLPFQPDDHGVIRRTAAWMTSKFARELGLQVTGGSSSVRDAWLPMREAGASARAMLVAEAARRWSIPVTQCTVEGSVVSGANGQHASFADLVSNWLETFDGRPPERIALKDPKDFRLIGTEVPRLDSLPKSNGQARFGLDVRPPGLVYAAVQMAPAIGGRMIRFDATAARAKLGVLQVTELPALQGQAGGIAVIAERYWIARTALASIQVQWDLTDGANVSTASLNQARQDALDHKSGLAFRNSGDISALAKPPLSGMRRIDAQYSAPYLAHATMEPMNCTALVDTSGSVRTVTVWAPTQVPSIARSIAARVAKADEKDVTVHVTFLGGGFGRRLEVDYVAQAVALASAFPGRPVQLIWSREQDIAHDYYRPAALGQFSALLAAGGHVDAFSAKIACDAITPQVTARDWPRLAADTPDKTTVEGAFDVPYEIANLRVAHVLVKAPVNIGYWRSVGHSYNAFFKESFVDELAHSAGVDPYQYRRTMLRHHERHLQVLDLAAERHGWDRPAQPIVIQDEENRQKTLKVARGIALHESFGSIVTQIADVSVDAGKIRVHRVTCVIDCGTAVNPNIIRQQMESGIIFGMSAALYGEITFAAGMVQQSNFSDYPVVRSNEVPVIEVHIMPSALAPTGVGEPGTAPIAPAIANAVFAATGNRLRSLPLRLT